MSESEETPEPAGSSSEIILYQTEDRRTQIDVRLEGETVWLNQRQSAELFETSISNVNIHIRNVFDEGELEEAAVVKEYLITASDAKRYQTKHYTLDVINSVGYRVKSHRGTQFRIRATGRLRKFLVKGFTLDDQRLARGGDTSRYFDELLERVRAIRASERMFWQKVTDIDATRVDYEVNAEVTREFFATIQNKFHFAIHGHTAAEGVAERVSAEKQNMVLDEDRRAALQTVMNERLDQRTVEIISRRFGIGDNPEETLEQIGKSMRVTRERIRQVEAKALGILKHPAHARKLEPYVA